MKNVITLLSLLFLSISSYAVIGPITGANNVCAGDTVILGDTSAGGVWTSSNRFTARIDSFTGVVTGLRAGTVTISYTIGSSRATMVFTVNPAPDAGRITGPTGMCLGDTMRVGETVTGGTWYMANGVATIAGGLVTSVSTGTDTILYTITNSCGSDTARRTINIGTPPAPISGTRHLCQGDTATLADADAGGTWRSGNFGVAVVIPTTSIVIALAPGTASISYTISGCSSTITMTVNALPASHAITGGGHFCPSDGGAPVRLNGSNNGIMYYLLYAGTFVLDSAAGTGSPINFGRQPIPGTYTALAINPLTGCMRNMTGTDTVIQDTSYIPLINITATPGVNIARGQPVTLHANNTNAGPAPTYQWVIGGTYIGGATSKNFTSNAFADGDSVSCFVTSHGICGSYTSEQYIILHVHPSGVQAVSAQGGFSIYPNPARGSFTMSLAPVVDEDAAVIITDMLGKEIKRFPIGANKQVKVDVDIAPGVYLVTGLTTHDTYTAKLVVE